MQNITFDFCMYPRNQNMFKSLIYKTMKNLFLIFGICFSLSAFAQNPIVVNPYSSYTVAGVPLDEINSELATVSFRLVRPFKRGFFVEVNYGQTCYAEAPLLYGREVVRNCTGIIAPDGKLMEVANYIEALNIMEQLGWRLVSVVEENSDGDSGPLSHSYIFRKKKDQLAE